MKHSNVYLIKTKSISNGLQKFLKETNKIHRNFKYERSLWDLAFICEYIREVSRSCEKSLLESKTQESPPTFIPLAPFSKFDKTHKFKFCVTAYLAFTCISLPASLIVFFTLFSLSLETYHIFFPFIFTLPLHPLSLFPRIYIVGGNRRDTQRGERDIECGRGGEGKIENKAVKNEEDAQSIPYLFKESIYFFKCNS